MNYIVTIERKGDPFKEPTLQIFVYDNYNIAKTMAKSFREDVTKIFKQEGTHTELLEIL